MDFEFLREYEKEFYKNYSFAEEMLKEESFTKFYAALNYQLPSHEQKLQWFLARLAFGFSIEKEKDAKLDLEDINLLIKNCPNRYFNEYEIKLLDGVDPLNAKIEMKMEELHYPPLNVYGSMLTFYYMLQSYQDFTINYFVIEKTKQEKKHLEVFMAEKLQKLRLQEVENAQPIQVL